MNSFDKVPALFGIPDFLGNDGDYDVVQIAIGEVAIHRFKAEKFMYIESHEKCRRAPFTEEILRDFSRLVPANCDKPCKGRHLEYGKRLNMILEHLPQCSTDVEEKCFTETLHLARKNILTKPCTKLQYKGEYSKYDQIAPNVPVPANQAIFLLQFAIKKVSVNEEYLIYDAVAMVGAIGGTIGLCIGFSFSDLTSILLGYAAIGIKWVNGRSRRNSDPRQNNSNCYIKKSEFDNTVVKIEKQITYIVKVLAEVHRMESRILALEKAKSKEYQSLLKTHE